MCSGSVHPFADTKDPRKGAVWGGNLISSIWSSSGEGPVKHLREDVWGLGEKKPKGTAGVTLPSPVCEAGGERED